MKLSRSFALLAISLSVFSTPTFAELDPDLAATSFKNNNGFFINGGLRLGQSYATGRSNPGVAAFAIVEPGFVATRDSWGRVETSLELGSGMMSFRRKNSTKDKVDMEVPLYAIAKVGYGWSIGNSMFNIIRLGAGPAIATYEADLSNSTTVKSDGTVTGFAGTIGYDILVPISAHFDVLGGVSFTHMAFDVDDGKINGSTANIDESVNVNLPAIHLAARVQF